MYLYINLIIFKSYNLMDLRGKISNKKKPDWLPIWFYKNF